MMNLPTIKKRAAERLSALELLLQEPPGSCEPCLLGNALTLGVLGNTCEQVESADPETCRGILHISEDIARGSKPPQETLLEVKRLRCDLLSKTPIERELCHLYELGELSGLDKSRGKV